LDEQIREELELFLNYLNRRYKKEFIILSLGASAGYKYNKIFSKGYTKLRKEVEDGT
jgi:hypothetical protein